MINCEDKKCYGCSACEAICPVKAIEMVNMNGFLYPTINAESCIECGLCNKVCPINNLKMNDSSNEIYAYKNNDIVRMLSTSGGFFSVLCEYIFAIDGVVYGAVFDEKFLVQHERTENMVGIEKMRGSKYLQSDIRNIFVDVKNDLIEGRTVLFSGTPCQNAAIVNYLKTSRVDIGNLLLCDFVCHGVPSPEIWGDYLEFLQKKYASKIKSVNFRSKENGWHKPELKIEFRNGKKQTLDERKDAYYQLFYSNCILRESCHCCEFSSRNRISDFTIADAWGINKNYSVYDDNRGISLILVNSKKAQTVFQSIHLNDSLLKITFDDIYQPHLSIPARRSPKRDVFWNEYECKGFEYVLRKYGNYSIYRKVLKKTKRLIIRILVLCRVRKN